MSKSLTISNPTQLDRCDVSCDDMSTLFSTDLEAILVVISLALYDFKSLQLKSLRFQSRDLNLYVLLLALEL